MPISKVVVYDHKYDATRLWWAFFYGETNVRVLDGGMKAWNTGYKTDLVAGGKAARPGTWVPPTDLPGNIT